MNPDDLTEVFVYRTASGLTIHHSERVNGQMPAGKWVKVPLGLVGRFVNAARLYREAQVMLTGIAGDSFQGVPVNFATIYAPNIIGARSTCTHGWQTPDACDAPGVIRFRMVMRTQETKTLISVTRWELACAHHAITAAMAYSKEAESKKGWVLECETIRECQWCTDRMGVCYCTDKCKAPACRSALNAVLA